ncbi:MAG: hypothetical protein R3F46_07635 [bacterium]
MRTLQILALLLLLAGNGLASSCSGQGRVPAEPQLAAPGKPQLPTPQQLEKRAVSATFPHFRLASDFVPDATVRTLPGLALGQRIFQPDYDSAGSGSGPAWAVYGILLSDYSGPDEIHLDWASAPAAADTYIGIANFSTKRWDWSQPADVSLVGTALDPDHTSATDVLYIAVLLTGTSEAVLNWVRAGGNIAPIVSFDASVRAGFGSVTSTLVASGVDPEGTPVQFEFDAFGSGSFADNGASGIVADVLYASPGAYHPVVRVTDGDGGVSEETITIGVGWVHSYGGSGYEGLNAAAPYAGGALLAAGITNTWTPAFDRGLIAAWQPTGNFANGNNFGNASATSEFTCLKTNVNNFAIIGGFTAEPPDFDQDHYVALLNQTGTILYQKLISSPDSESGMDAAIDDSANAVVVCSYGTGGDTGLLLLRIDTGGSIVLQKLLSGSGPLSDPRVHLDQAGNIYICAGMDRSPLPGNDIVAMQLDPAGVLQWARRLNTPFRAELRGMVADADALYISGTINAEMPGVADGGYLACIGLDGQFGWNRRLDFGNPNAGWTRLTIDQRNGELMLCGITSNQGGADFSLCGLLARYSNVGELLYINAYNQPNINNQFIDIAYDRDGGFYVVGSGQGVTGDFYEPSYTAFNDVLGWESISLTIADAVAAITNWDAAFAANDAPPPVFDAPAGSSDAIVMRWFQP